MVFITNNQTAVILERSALAGRSARNSLPAKGMRSVVRQTAVPLSTVFYSVANATILGGGLFPITSMRSDQINVAFIDQLLVQFIAVISLVVNDCVRNMLQKTGIQRLLNQRYFMRLSTCCANGDRK